MQKDITVIIVGSGVSGAKAAQGLASMGGGIKVIVLEASDHIGGRTKSVPIKLKDQSTFHFDLGATWIHSSCKQHPITRIMKQAGLQAVPDDEFNQQTFDSNGKLISKKEVEQSRNEYKNILKKLENSDKDTTVYEGISKKYPDKLKSPLFMFNVAYDLESETSAPVKDLSAWEAYGDDEFDGDEMVVLNGYERVSECLLKKSGAQVMLGHKVVEVVKTADGSEIRCSNGARFKAEKVIITVPLGVLKKEAIKFTPALPKEKLAAINHMGFGNVCKVLVVFDKPITAKKQHYFSYIPEDPKEGGLVTYFLNFQALAGKPAFLTLGLGEWADIVETMPEDKLKSILAKRLKTFVQMPVDEQSFRVYRSGWRNNPDVGGAYSYPRVGCSYKDYEALARPVFECGWLFAGEHTSFRYRASAHGAYFSGMYAAKQLMSNPKEWAYQDHQWYLDNKD